MQLASGALLPSLQTTSSERIAPTVQITARLPPGAHGRRCQYSPHTLYVYHSVAPLEQMPCVI
eukprot:904339-Pyramimonas_sp.AAC.1